MRVLRHYVRHDSELQRLCSLSRELYNKCNHVLRQDWFAGQRFHDLGSLIALVKNERCFVHLHNTKTAKQTIRKLLVDWSNFRKALSAYRKDSHKFLRQPKPPHYKEKLGQVVFYAETIKGGRAGKPLVRLIPTNECFDVPAHKGWKQVVVTPKTFGFVIEVQYQEEKTRKKKPGTRTAAIDLGVNNLCAITTDQRLPLLVNGRIVKSINQWYNKKPTRRNSEKRYWRLENYFHHVSKMVVKHCVDNEVGHLVIGKNDGWKCGSRMGRIRNQSFHSIPHQRLLDKIEYKAEAVGISIVYTEEAYTSQASYLDRDPLPVYVKGVSHEFSGRRVHRGLYQSDNVRLNADVNGSYNVGRKVIGDAFGIADRSLAARPVRINPLKAFCV
jgi:putative transposase